MDTHSLTQCFCHIISLTSLAYTFSGIHTIQYSMHNHDMDSNDPEDQNLQDNDLALQSGLTSIHDTPNIANT